MSVCAQENVAPSDNQEFDPPLSNPISYNAPPATPQDFERFNIGKVRNLDEHQPRVIHGNHPLSWYLLAKRISIFELYGNYREYQDKMISVIGYFSHLDGCTGQNYYYIYPTREAYEVRDPRESVVLKLNDLFKCANDFQDGSLIEAVGIFSSNGSRRTGAPVGALRQSSIRKRYPHHSYSQVGDSEKVEFKK